MSENKTYKNSQEFKNYFSGNLKNDDKTRFEEEVAEDEFEKEAFEGFQSMENQTEVATTINEIEQLITEKTGAKRAKTVAFPIWKSLSIAATVLIVVGLGFLLSQFLKTENNIAENTSNKQNENPLQEAETLYNVVSDEQIDTLLEEELTTESNTNQEEKTPIAQIIVKEESTLKTKEATPTTTADAKENAVENDIAERKKDNYLLEDIAIEAEESSAQATPSAGKQSVVNVMESYPSGSNYELAQSLYKEKQYSSAKNYFKKSAKEGKNIEESDYYTAMCDYNLGNQKSAKNSFSGIINSGTSYTNNAKWFKAMILIDEGNETEAKTLLQDLANGNSGFKNQAQDKLNSIY